MRPVLFQIGSFKLHSYGALLVVAFFVGLWVAKRRAKKFDINPSALDGIAMAALVLGVLGARIVYILQELPHYLKPENRSELFSLQFNGLTSFGGLLFGFLGVVWMARRHRIGLGTITDLLAPSFLIGHAIGRVGCLLNGCCFGGVCDKPWAIHAVDEHGIPFLAHPAQIYDSFFNIAGLALVLWVERRGLATGKVTGLALIVHGLSRFIYEFWRAGWSSAYWGSLPITQAQAVALTIALIGLVVFVVAHRAGTQGAPDETPEPHAV